MLAVLCLLSWTSASVAEPVRVAVASNFVQTAQQLRQAFAEVEQRSVVLSVGSTGRLYAQIRQGAPFALFLAADSERPLRLANEREGGPRPVTYALGRLVLWWPQRPEGLPMAEGLQQLQFHTMALANPRIAPYGLAAQQSLQQLGLWPVARRVVRGESVSQALQFVQRGEAQLGWVAYAQMRQLAIDPQTYWRVPASLHAPIVQQALLLQPQGEDFLAFMVSEAGREIIAQAGYGLPGETDLVQ